ncbi:MAG: hypothetical protein AAB645_02700 [Patescibacteria group bacterium]
MDIITVTPINKGVFKESLIYFSAQDVTLGSIVVVPIKNRQIDAMVIGIENIRNVKSEIKRADYSLKKVLKVKTRRLFLPEFITACQQTADYFATNLGQVIKSVTPKIILEEMSEELLVPNVEINISVQTDDNVVKLNKFIIQEEDTERIGYYKSLIRESFAKKNSVFMCLPTATEAAKAAEAFDKGIKDFTVILQNNLPKKVLLASWTKAVTSKHPLLIIATPLFLSLPRHDIKTIIMEKENSSTYKDLSRPFIDFRIFSEFLADQWHARLIYGDLVIRSESVFKTEKGEYTALSPLKYRSFSEAEQIIIPNGITKDATQKNLTALSDNLKLIISDSLHNKKKILIYSGRKGVAPNTACNDCGTIVHCERCQSPLVLHRLAEGKTDQPYIYICHKCGLTKEVEDRCPNCGSWRLALLGFGIDKVEEEIKDTYPDSLIFKLDSTTIKNSKKGQEIAGKFYDTKGAAILLATEMAVSFLTEKIDTVALVAIDSIFALPDFRISEKIFNVILKLRRFAEWRFVIQTRNPSEKVFSYAIKGNLLDFYREEIEERMKFGYPPFKVLIKITYEGIEKEVVAKMETLRDKLIDYHPTIFPAFTPRIKNCYRMHLLIKLTPAQWIDQNLLGELKSLSPDWIVDVEPESIL